MLDYIFHLEHVDIVPPDMTIRRCSTKINELGYILRVNRPPWTSQDDADAL